MTAVRFCSACGTRLASAPPVTCTVCGVQHWLNPKPCGNAILVRDGKVLLARRAHAPWEGMWCAPGGFCEAGEHPIETVVREVAEETGLRVAVTGYVGVWVDRYSDDPDEADAQIINVGYYHAAMLGDDQGLLDPAEVSEIGWFAWDELPDDLAPPGTLASVLALARRVEHEDVLPTDLPA